MILLKGTDEEKLRQLTSYAQKQKPAEHRVRVHLQLQSQQTLRMLQTQDLSDEIRKKLELHPFSFEELWAEELFLNLPNRPSPYQPLDYVPLRYDSPHRVHLIVFGMNAMSEAIVRQAALIAHYPNYVRDHRLRTRITVVDPSITPENNLFTQRWGVLFENSYYSVESKEKRYEHTPENQHLGEAFTDIEWAFIQGDSMTPELRTSLKDWSQDTCQLLTVIFAYDDEEKNLDAAQNLPSTFQGIDIPIYVRQHSDERLRILSPMPQYKNLRAFGMDQATYDMSCPLTSMARSINYIYDHCYHDMTDRDGRLSHIDSIPHEEAARLLDSTRMINRFSSEVNAMTIASKMRSLGYTTTDQWADQHSLSPAEVDQLSEVEHNRWSMERLLDGVRPVTPQEQALVEQDIQQKEMLKKRGIHYDLRSYAALTSDSTGRNVVIYDNALTVNIPLIARTYIMEDHGIQPQPVQARYKEPPIKQLKTWHIAAAILVLVLMMVGGGFALYRHDKADVICKQALENSVYLIKVDSIMIQQTDYESKGGMIKEQISIIQRIKPQADYYGTAFLTQDGYLMTARHCVEYWWYDGALKLSDESTYTPETRLAMDVEVYNKTHENSQRRLITTNILMNAYDTIRLTQPFFINDTMDRVIRVFTEEGKKYWRITDPCFEHENHMRLSDFAKLHYGTPGRIKTLNALPEVDSEVFILGYPKNEGKYVYQVRRGMIRQVDPEMGFQIEATGVAKGFSGGPVIMKTKGGYSVVGVISHWDKSDEVKSVWAVPVF